MRKTSEGKCRLKKSRARRTQGEGQMLIECGLGWLLQKRCDGRKQGWRKDDHDHSNRPKPRGRERSPSQDQQERQSSWNQAASKVVENLPAGKHGNRIPLKLAVAVGDPRQHPLRNLPVSPDPTVPAIDVCEVVRWILLEEWNIA